MKALLTSAGFENKQIADHFLKLIGKNPNEIKVIFVPTAANNPDAISVLPKCMNDLLKIGIEKHNILVYDLHKAMKYQLLKGYDAIYFCGGSTDYLSQRIHETGFKKALLKFITNDGVYVGVSAGSCVAAKNVKKNLGLIQCIIKVHCDKGEMAGSINDKELTSISLTNQQAILITNNRKEIIE